MVNFFCHMAKSFITFQKDSMYEFLRWAMHVNRKFKMLKEI